MTAEQRKTIALRRQVISGIWTIALDEARSVAVSLPRGFTAIAEEMHEISGVPFSSKHVCAWLHTNPTQRIEPSFGVGILLLEAAHNVAAAAGPKRRHRKKV